MRWSSYTEAGGGVRAAVWQGDRLHPAPPGTALIDLLGDLGGAAEVALAGPGVDPESVTLLAPVPRPPYRHRG